jgi:hypothetical protein
VRWGVERLVLGWALAALPACAAPSHSNVLQEVSSMSKSSSRIPAPAVAPIVLGNVRYEQVGNGLLAGFDQMGGYLAAYDVASGDQLWTLKVYDNQRQPGKEGDVQDVFFKSMQATPSGQLLIENEQGGRFLVNPLTRSVTPQ